MTKILTIVGARPQFVKAAVVSRAIEAYPELHEVIVHTGQHYDANMSDIFLNELAIPPVHHHLNVGSHSHGKQTGEMLTKIEAVLLEEKPDWVLIYGDTNSTLAGAIAAVKLHIPVAHVEAGLRSYNRRMPEEINRLVADQLSQVLFTPTEQAVTNLLQEGFTKERIVTVGDVMYDAALFYAERAEKKNLLNPMLPTQSAYVLATVHRAENTDDVNRLRAIFNALSRLSDDIPVILPLHPRTRKMLLQHEPTLLTNTSITFIEPVGFLEMILLEKNAALIVTDSGGVQKEAFFYQVPCVTLRDETEWLETVTLGWNRLAPPTDADTLLQRMQQALGTRGEDHHLPYGDGRAAKHITHYFLRGT